MFEKNGYQGIRTKMMIFYFIFFPKQTRAKCIQINHAKRLLGLFFILLIISFYLNHLKFLLVAFDSTEEHSPLFFRASFCLLSRKTVWKKIFFKKHTLCNDWVMLLKINKLYLMTEVYSNTYKTDCLQAGILLTKKG